ncbi:ParM/StbA family protein [Burkholderia sp. MBR-1]|uniref:ParM/StbA family protein n=1 Tax=Burkholderia sp. MBR-1 TaxID=2732364 RepID=UPI0015EEEFB3|nr:ParM/StbA family protein [Burkholderia sp. MBR-1]QMI49702.1 ParM/StbA family protein [Burkholderia sp. MBR-1]
MDLVVALDIGHSTNKCLAVRVDSPTERTRAFFPTCVAPAVEISDAATRERALRETVEVAGQRFFFGQTARKQSGAKDFFGLNSDWVFDPMHDALLLGGLQTMLSNFPERPSRLFVVLGLPAENYDTHKAEFSARAASLITRYLGNTSTQVQVRIQSQPHGVLSNLIFMQDGNIQQTRDIDNELWGILDLGHFSADYLMFDEGDMIQSAFGSADGVHKVYQKVSQLLEAKSLPKDLRTLEQAIRLRTVKHYGNDINVGADVDAIVVPFADSLIDETRNRFGRNIGKMNGIILAGGGADLIFDRFQKAFPNAIKPDNPQFSVAEGFTRFGLYLARNAQ